MAEQVKIGLGVEGRRDVQRELALTDRAVREVGQGLDRLDGDADAAGRALRGLGRDGSREMRGLASDVDRSTTGVGRDLREIGQDTERAGREFRELATDAERSARRMQGAFDDVEAPSGGAGFGGGAGGALAAGAGAAAAVVGRATGAAEITEDIFFGLGDDAIAQAASVRTGVDADIIDGIVQRLSVEFATLGSDQIAEAFVAVKENLPTEFGSILEDRIGQIAQLELAGVGDTGEIARSVANAAASFDADPTRTLDLIVNAVQSGANRQGDFFDTLTEYSSAISESGLALDDFIGQITRASDPALGIRNTDLPADAIRELVIKLNEGGDDIEEALSALDLDLGEVQTAFASGEGREFFADIVNGIQAIRDTQQGKDIGRILFGTPFEDAGTNLLDVLALTEARIQGVDGAARAAANTLQGTFYQRNLGGLVRDFSQATTSGFADVPRDPLGLRRPRTGGTTSDISSIANVTVNVNVPQPVVNAGVVTSATDIRSLFGRFITDAAPQIAREVERQIQRSTVFGRDGRQFGGLR